MYFTTLERKVNKLIVFSGKHGISLANFIIRANSDATIKIKYSLAKQTR